MNKGLLPSGAVLMFAAGLLVACARVNFFSGTFEPVAPPTFSMTPGTYPGPVTVAISDATPGFTIRYTTVPNAAVSDQAAWSTYSGPISVQSTTNLQAYAYSDANNLSVVVSGLYAITFTATLAAPTNLLVGSETAANSLPVSWKSVSGATGYSLLRSTSSSFTSPSVVCSGAVTSCTDSTVSPGTQYFYEVEATDPIATSPPSAQVTAATLSSSGLPLSVPIPFTPSTPPNSLLSASPGDYWDSGGGMGPVGTALLNGGYVYLFYTHDYNNGVDTAVAIYDSIGNFVTGYLEAIGRYATTVTITGTTVVFGGPYAQTACPTPSTCPYSIAWSAIPP